MAETKVSVKLELDTSEAMKKIDELVGKLKETESLNRVVNISNINIYVNNPIKDQDITEIKKTLEKLSLS